MRWNNLKLYEVTGKKTKSAQARWFKNTLGTIVPVDQFGVVMNDGTYDALLKKKCGIEVSINTSFINTTKNPPKLRL